MPRISSHIPFLKTIDDFFRVYRLGKPLHPEIMCMRLEDQPDEKLMHMPIYRANFFRVIHFTNANLHFTSGEKDHGFLSGGSMVHGKTFIYLYKSVKPNSNGPISSTL
jgi:hypothetical protein